MGRTIKGRVYDFTKTLAVLSHPGNDPLAEFLNRNRYFAYELSADDFKLSFIRSMTYQPDKLTWFYRHKKTKELIAITSALECYVREGEQIVQVSPQEALRRFMYIRMLPN